MSLHRSALHSVAAASGAKFQEHFGWETPAEYSGMSAEYEAAISAASLHDSSYMGRLKANGADGLDLLNRMSTNKVVDLEPGQGAPTVLTNDRGRIVDLIGVINIGDHLLLTTSPGLQQTIIDWLDKYTILEDLTLEDITSSTSMPVVLGPGSQAALEAVTGVGLTGLAPFHTLSADIGGHRVQLINQPLGELPGFAIVASLEAAPVVWQGLEEQGMAPMGMAAYEAVRVRYAVPVHGQEMGEPYNPLEAGLIGSIDFAKGCYIGQEVIARLDTYRKVQKSLVSLRFSPDASAGEGGVLTLDDRPVGTVTSAIQVPATGETLGLGYVRVSNAIVGTRLELEEPATGWVEVLAIPQLFGPGPE